MLTCAFVQRSNDFKSSDSSSINASLPRLSLITCSYVFLSFIYCIFSLLFPHFILLLFFATVVKKSIIITIKKPGNRLKTKKSYRSVTSKEEITRYLDKKCPCSQSTLRSCHIPLLRCPLERSLMSCRKNCRTGRKCFLINTNVGTRHHLQEA